MRPYTSDPSVIVIRRRRPAHVLRALELSRCKSLSYIEKHAFRDATIEHARDANYYDILLKFITFGRGERGPRATTLIDNNNMDISRKAAALTPFGSPLSNDSWPTNNAKERPHCALMARRGVVLALDN